MFKVLMILVSLNFSLSFQFDKSTSRCVYDGFGRDSTYKYLDVDGVSHIILVPALGFTQLPYLSGNKTDVGMHPNAPRTYDKGEILHRSNPWWSPSGKRLVRCYLYLHSSSPCSYSFKYNTFNTRMQDVIVKTCTTTANVLYKIDDIMNNTSIVFDTVKYGWDMLPTPTIVTDEGDALIYDMDNGTYNKETCIYFYLKNATSSNVKASYTYVSAFKKRTIVTDSILCPANSITEVPYAANNTSVWIGNVSYNNVQLGDKIVINTGDAVENINVNKLNPLTVYPNPSNGVLNVKLNSKSDIRIFTLDGKLIQSYNNTSSIKADALKNGVYLVSAKQGGVEMRRMVTIVR